MKRLLSFAGACLLLAVAATGISGRETNDSMEAGKAAFEKGDISTAINTFDRILSQNPKLVEAYLWRGKAYFAEGDNPMASADFTAVLEFDPKNVDAYTLRGDLYAKERDYDLALWDYSQVMMLRPNSPEVLKKENAIEHDRATISRIAKGEDQQLFDQASDAAIQGKIDEAIGDYTRALALNPKLLSALAGRAILYGRKGDHDKSIADWTRAIELDSNFADGYRLRSISYRNQGKFDLALADANAAIKLNPDLGQSFNARGLVYLYEGDYAKAVADFTQAIHPDPKVVAAIRASGGQADQTARGMVIMNLNPQSDYYWRGISYLLQHHYDKALADFDEEILKVPNDVNVHFRKAEAYEAKGAHGKAAAEFDAATKLMGQNPVIFNEVAWNLAVSPLPITRHGKKAVEYALKACDLTNWQEPNDIDTLAAAYAEAGDFESAVKWEQKFLEYPKLDPSIVEGGEKRLELFKSHHDYHNEQ